MNFHQRLRDIKTDNDFSELAMDVFRFQYENNPVYNAWCNALRIRRNEVRDIGSIPFLPISFFKTHRVTSRPKDRCEDYFLSSGTGSMQRSTHYIYSRDFYLENTARCFEEFFSEVEDYCYICLLPNYLEQEHSSLVCMMDSFVKKSKCSESGFFRDELDKVAEILEDNENKGIKTILFGVTYALLDLIERQPLRLRNTVVFETGGMKGRRKEMLKSELHRVLGEGLGVKSIASEYGMCELLSQAYSKGGGIFYTPKSMKVSIREVNDFREETPCGKSGVINIIDLANIDSCAFIQTEDVGRKHSDGSFEIMGRLDHSALRGCNLMYGE